MATPQTIFLDGSLRDLPFYQLFEKDITQMTEPELRELAQVLREQAGSGTARKAAVAKQAKVMTGKAVKMTTLDDLFG